MSILLVLGMEIVNRVRHDVSWVHGFLKKVKIEDFSPKALALIFNWSNITILLLMKYEMALDRTALQRKMQ